MGTISNKVKKEIVQTWENTKPTSSVASEDIKRVETFVKALEAKKEPWNPTK